MQPGGNTHFLSNAETTEYEASIVRPENIIEGEPRAGVHWLRQAGSDGEPLLIGMFTVQPSKYRYTFPGDETLHLIEGSLDIELETGEVLHLEPGAIASFPSGARSVWVIHEPVRKFFVVANVESAIRLSNVELADQEVTSS